MARHDSTSRAARSTEGTPTNEKAAASGETTFLRLRLPLPERTGSDRDEPLCPPGFVDRAYLVFCLVTILQTLPNQIDDSMMTGFDATLSLRRPHGHQGSLGVRAPNHLAFVTGDDRGRPLQARWRCADAPGRPGSKASLPMRPSGAAKQALRPAPVSASFTQHPACHEFVTGDSSDHRMSQPEALQDLVRKVSSGRVNDSTLTTTPELLPGT